MRTVSTIRTFYQLVKLILVLFVIFQRRSELFMETIFVVILAVAIPCKCAKRIRHMPYQNWTSILGN